jgi:hypothetical protein
MVLPIAEPWSPRITNLQPGALEKGKGLSILEYCVRLVEVAGFLSKSAPG